ncbi:MAG TPA: type 1 glutamine amidotransferase [Actinomycetota bacterium]|nr:type 1 glutamine amidotransferase [Actinomycetota bacterium]
MKPLVLVRNDGFETYGVAVPSLRSAGVELLLVDAFEGEPLPELSEVAGVVMLGGTVNADQVDGHPFLLEDRALTREAVDTGVPFLGVCLGAQILARALGRPVMKAARRELGFQPIHPTEAAADDRLLSAFADGDRVFQWHQDTFELPEGATLLATGEDVPHQAFRVGDLAWGIQFHFEIDGAELEQWLDEAEALMDLEATWGKSSEDIRLEAKEHMAAHEQRGDEVFRRFADVVRRAAR